MAAPPCYSGPNPVTPEERQVIWKWAKEHGGVDIGTPIDQVGDSINKQFFSGRAPEKWITDIISGRKTPFRQVANEMWKKQYNRRIIQQQAEDIHRTALQGPVSKWLKRIAFVPRTVAVAGHGVVFPITHAGDLIFRPASWGTFIKGVLRTYRASLVPTRFGGGKGYAGRMMRQIEGAKMEEIGIRGPMERDSLFDMGLQSGVDVGKGSHATGLLSKTYHGPASRAWDALTVMRFELWKKQMAKFVTKDMTHAEVLDIGQNLAKWANHATGSGKGGVANLGGNVLFGPKLTQSKINRLTIDPKQTIDTFQKMARGVETTAGERAAAWTRLSGAMQWAGTNAVFLGINQGLLYALGSKEKLNLTDPMKGDFWAFKVPGMHGYVPGLHTEVRTLAQILATSWSERKERRGLSKFAYTGKILGGYGMAKLMPTFQRVGEVGFGEDYIGRPVPWSSDPGTATFPRLTYGEYAGDIGPIPLSGPIGYVYDQFQKQGMSKSDSIATVKALIVHGLKDPKAWAIGAVGAPGLHIREEHPPAPPKGGVSNDIKKLLKQRSGATRPKNQADIIKQLLKQRGGT